MIPDHLVYIRSPLVQAIPTKDNGEPLVDLYEYAGDRRSDLRTQPGVQVREGVADKLINAQEYLPGGVYLYITEGYRSPERQKELYDWHYGVLKQRHPDWNYEQLKEEASKLYSPPGTTTPHATGGAVDVTLVDDKGKLLDMGTQINDDAEATGNKTYTLTQGLSNEQMGNRMKLIEALNYAQFTNYSTEWWHWSVGDQYWAFTHKQPAALYGMVKV